MSVEKLRLKELRLDNEILESKLEAKESEVLSLNRKVEVGDRQLGVEKYRDVVTGFYRLNYLYQIKEEELLNVNACGNSSGFSFYNTLAVLEIEDYIQVHKSLGPLAAAELISKISVELRQKTNSDTQIFCIQNGMFLLLNGDTDKEALNSRLVNLRYHIIRSEYEVGNGLSASTNISLTLADISQSKVLSKTMLITVINLLIQAHRQCENSQKMPNRQIQINKTASYFMQDSTGLELGVTSFQWEK